MKVSAMAMSNLVGSDGIYDFHLYSLFTASQGLIKRLTATFETSVSAEETC